MPKSLLNGDDLLEIVLTEASVVATKINPTIADYLNRQKCDHPVGIGALLMVAASHAKYIDMDCDAFMGFAQAAYEGTKSTLKNPQPRKK